MLQEAVTLWEQHQRFSTDCRTVHDVWQDFNRCFYHIQWKPVCIVPSGPKNLPIWLWKKGFQEDYGSRRHAVRINRNSNLFNILTLFHQVDVDKLSGLSRESKRRMHYIFPNIPEITPALKTETLTTAIHLPGFLVGDNNTQLTEVGVCFRFLSAGFNVRVGHDSIDSFDAPIEFAAYISLAHQYDAADKLVQLLREALEVRKRKEKDLRDLQTNLGKYLNRYLVFQEV